MCVPGVHLGKGGVCLKSVCQLRAYVCLHRSYIGGGGGVFALSLRFLVPISIALKKPSPPLKQNSKCSPVYV